MIDLAPDRLLFIEPQLSCSAEPVVDEYTRRMAGAMCSASPQQPSHGIHRCRCGATSANRNYVVRIAQRVAGSPWHGLLTHSLAVHYLAFHRDEVPPGELAKVLVLSAEPCEPRLAPVTSKDPGYILRCARVGSELVDGTPPGTVEWLCARCSHSVHVTPKSLEKVHATSALHVVLCVECVRDPRLPDFLATRATRGGN